MDHKLLSLYRDDWIRKLLSIASYTCLVYDHTLTFDKEVEFIWQAPWTFTKAIFLLNRYGNLVCQTIIQFFRLVGMPDHTTESCDLPTAFTSLYAVSSQESIHILVLLRAWAIWGCDRRVAMTLIGSYSVYLLFFTIKAIFSTISVTIRTFRHANLPEVCVTVVAPKSWVLPLASACQDTVVFTVTMISLWRHARISRNLYPTSLLFLLVRDAVMFYSVNIFYDVFNAASWVVYPARPQNMLFMTFTLNLLSIAGQRFVLNLRGFTVRTYGSRSLSAEVDRQLHMFSGTQRLEWWSPPSDSSRAENRNTDVEMADLDRGPRRLSESRGGHDREGRHSEGVDEAMPGGLCVMDAPPYFMPGQDGDLVGFGDVIDGRSSEVLPHHLYVVQV